MLYGSPLLFFVLSTEGTGIGCSSLRTFGAAGSCGVLEGCEKGLHGARVGDTAEIGVPAAALLLLNDIQ